METVTKHERQAQDGANGINGSDGDHTVDDNFESIGFLAGTILSRVKARKETTGAAEIRSGGQYAQTKPLGRKARGCLASNEKDVGGHFETSKSSTDERAVFLAR